MERVLINDLKKYYDSLDEEHKKYKRIRSDKKKRLGYYEGLKSNEVQKNNHRLGIIKEQKVLINRLIKLMESE